MVFQGSLSSPGCDVTWNATVAAFSHSGVNSSLLFSLGKRLRWWVYWNGINVAVEGFYDCSGGGLGVECSNIYPEFLTGGLGFVKSS